MKIASKHIVSVEAYDRELDSWYVYKEKRTVRFLGIPIKTYPEGFYNTISAFHQYRTREQIERDGVYEVVGKSVFELPNVLIDLTGDDFVSITFPTYEQAVSFAEIVTYLATVQDFIDLETIDYDPQPKRKEN